MKRKLAKLIQRIEVLTLEPGDVLVATVPSRTPMSACAELRRDLEGCLPGGVTVIVAPDSIALSAVRPGRA